MSTDLDGMLKEAREFTAIARDQPVEIFALTADYRKSVPLPATPPPNSLARQQQQKTLDELGHAYLELRDYKANIVFVLSRPLTDFDQYRTFGSAAIDSARRQFRQSLNGVGKEIDNIVRRATDCAADFNHCQTYSTAIARLDLPTIGGELMNLKQMEDKEAYAKPQLFPVGS